MIGGVTTGDLFTGGVYRPIINGVSAEDCLSAVSRISIIGGVSTGDPFIGRVKRPIISGVSAEDLFTRRAIIGGLSSWAVGPLALTLRQGVQGIHSRRPGDYGALQRHYSLRGIRTYSRDFGFFIGIVHTSLGQLFSPFGCLVFEKLGKESKWDHPYRNFR